MVEMCSLCTKPATLRCSGCRVVYYCCREHQKLDWRKHRPGCSTFKVHRSEELGRHLVASRGLRTGEIILREAPLVTGPLLRALHPLCVACYRTLPPSAAPVCARCGWTLCNTPACANNLRHRPECAALVRAGKKVNVIAALAEGHPVYRALMVARCMLLRDSNPETWQRLQRLEAHCAKRQASGQWERERHEVARFLLPFLGLEDRFSEEDVLFMCGVVQVNTYPVLLPEPSFVAIYDEASFIEHSCVPNTSKVFAPNGELLLKTARSVKSGEHLAICYVEPGLGTAPRRAQLAAELLNCFCERCIDASELGTGFSALLCPNQKCKGLIHPLQPILEIAIEKKQEIWQCDTCKFLLTQQEVSKIISRAQAITSLAQEIYESPRASLASASKLGLGPNHYLLLSQRVKAICTYVSAPDQSSDSELEQKEQEIQQLIKLVNRLLPADCGLHGMLLFNLHAILLERILKKSRLRELNADHKYFKEIKTILMKSVRALEGYSEELAEGRLLKLAKAQLKAFGSHEKRASDDIPLEGPQPIQPPMLSTVTVALAS